MHYKLLIPLISITLFACNSVGNTPLPATTKHPSKTIVPLTSTVVSPSPTQTLVPINTPELLTTGKIAFISQRNGVNAQLYLIHTDGTNLTKLEDDSGNCEFPTWSLDGKAITYVTNPNMESRLGIVTIESLQVIFPKVNFSAKMPSWSPDGKQIAFSGYRNGQSDIYTTNLDGLDVKGVTNDAAADIFPLWSPNGDKIAFASTRDGNYAIYLMDSDGSNSIQLTESNGSIPIGWSPDGTKLIFSQDNEIYIARLDNEQTINLTHHAAYDGSAAWSPDGSKIAFVSDRDGDLEIYVVNVDGSEIAQLTNNTVWEDSPSWSPDGTRLAFTSNRDGNFEIYVMNIDGTRQTRLTTDAELDIMPIWQP